MNIIPSRSRSNPVLLPSQPRKCQGSMLATFNMHQPGTPHLLSLMPAGHVSHGCTFPGSQLLFPTRYDYGPQFALRIQYIEVSGNLWRHVSARCWARADLFDDLPKYTKKVDLELASSPWKSEVLFISTNTPAASPLTSSVSPIQLLGLQTSTISFHCRSTFHSRIRNFIIHYHGRQLFCPSSTELESNNRSDSSTR
jgi:hypothetical protein